MKFMKKNKTILIVGVICLIVFLLMAFAIYHMFYPSSESVYGDRLDNAPEIDNAVIERIKDKIMDTNLVDKVDYVTSVATMKFFISVKDDTKITDAQKLSEIILNTLSDKVIKFYDIEINLTNEKNEQYPVVGYHSKNASTFSWVDNVGEEDEK